MYSKPDCPYCLKAERALIRSEIEFEKKIIGIDISVEDFKQLRFDLLKLPNHFNLSSLEKPFYQGEILVPTKIPINYIKNLDEVMSFIN
jgi:glutaredoxin